MKRVRKLISIIIAALFIIQWAGVLPAFAAEYGPAPVPQRLRVEAINTTPPNAEPPIGYNEFDKYYVDLKSDKLGNPSGVGSHSKFLNYYLQEVNKPYKPAKPTVLKVGSVPENTSGDNAIRLRDLTSGTVYYAYAKSYYTVPTETGTYTSPESASSNIVKFMTDIAITAYSYGPNQIKIEWDDVWNSGKRIDYKLYVSESKAFSNTAPIYIGQEQIGPGKAVTVNEATGKLEYVHTVRDPGRVYYIKIVPDTTDSELKRSPESPTVSVSSFILAKTTKMSDSPDGAIWKLEWSPVVTGIGGNVKVTYQIYRGSSSSGSVEQYVASVDDTSFFLTIKPGEEDYYYVVRALVTSNGEDVYPGIKIQSQKIYVKESEVPSTPAVPEIVPEFRNAGEVIISYEQMLKPTSATILWKTPLKGDGRVDEDVSYDIWLISDPNQLDDPPSYTLIASSVKMNQSNYVMSGTKLLGYKYTINDLSPNSTYYFKIVAKKSFVEFVDNELTQITLYSDPAMKIIITPPAGAINQPVVPARPPFQLKKDAQGRDMVSTTSVVVTLKNKWYEQYTILEGGTGAWVYRTPEQLEADNPGIVDKLENHPEQVNPLEYRIVEYDDGVTIDVGWVEYTEGMDYSSIESLPTNKIIGFPVTPNDPDEDVTAPGALPDGKKHNVDITITGLEPNKTYVIWIRASRISANLTSGPSNPIIVTTQPVLPDIIEKPTVPVFNYHDASDTYIDLGWNFNPKYVYYLEYGTVDDRSKATGRLIITPDELALTTYYRVQGLKPDTLYYFWIQAEATNAAGDKERSEFSDSYMVRTLKEAPPATPRGFGIKNGPDGVTKNSITYEWIMEPGLSYILEIAGDIDYEDSRKFETGQVSEFTVQNLRSNYRYYARLYAYDPQKGLMSAPTQSVTVRTLRSSDDYDSSEDVENVIKGDFVVKDTVAVNGTWTVKILGVNADRFVEYVQTDRALDYYLDLTQMPKNTRIISVHISQKVFKALDMLKENIYIKTVRNTLVIKPGVLADKNGGYRAANISAYYRIDITLDSTADGSNTRNLVFKTPVSQVEVALSDGMTVTLTGFNKPLNVIYEYTSAGWYKHGTTLGLVLPQNSAEWRVSAATGVYDPDSGKGMLVFETSVPGKIAVGERGTDYYDDISTSYARKSIVNVASLYKLKAVSGTRFEPGKMLTMEDAAKFMLDIMGVDYGTNYMSLAVKSGIVERADSANPAALCTREKLVAMAVRVIELKTSRKAVATVDDTGIYRDAGQISVTLLPKIKFALENGVITSRFNDTFGPKDPVTRAEAMVLIEKILKFAGEL